MAKEQRAGRIPVYLERGTRKVFACALEWPGWCRSAKTAELALAALAGYAGRYTIVTDEAGVAVSREISQLVEDGAVGADNFDFELFQVTESVMGGSTTDFGAPGTIPAADGEPVDAPTAARHLAILRAAWTVLDRVAAGASTQLRKGPRGGGRDLVKILDHVVAAESAYARRLGVKCRPPTFADRSAVNAMRADIATVLGEPSDGSLFVPTGWPARYAARRITWHVLDHAWEIQDRR